MVGLYFINPVSATWYDNSYMYNVNVTVANETSSNGQLFINVSTVDGTNNNTFIFCNGNCIFNKINNSYVNTNILFVADNLTEFPFWFKNISSNNNTAIIIVNKTSNFSKLEMYFGGINRSYNNSNAGLKTMPVFADSATWTLWSVGSGTWNSTANGEIGLVGTVSGYGVLYTPFNKYNNIEIGMEYRISYSNVGDYFFVKATTANGLTGSFMTGGNPASNRVEIWDNSVVKNLSGFTYNTPPTWYNAKTTVNNDNTTKFYLWLDGTTEPINPSIQQSAFTIASTGTNAKLTINDVPANALHIYKYFYIINRLNNQWSNWSATNCFCVQNTLKNSYVWIRG